MSILYLSIKHSKKDTTMKLASLLICILVVIPKDNFNLINTHGERGRNGMRDVSSLVYKLEQTMYSSPDTRKTRK